MNLCCPREKAHRTFKRVVVVEGPTYALLDEHGDVLQYNDCGMFRMIRSTSDIRCAACHAKPTIQVC